MAKNLMITATRHNEGKTAITLGITAYLCKKVQHIGFIKPVGKVDVSAGGQSVDEDTILIEKTCGVHCYIGDMNPILIHDQGFPKSYMEKEVYERNLQAAREAYDRIAERKEIVVMEGTGHAAVGEVFGLSNASIAREFGAKVVLVSSGGVGHPIDEIHLNRRYFQSEGVSLLGVIINKVFPHEYEQVNTVSRRILEDCGIPFLGAIPFVPDLYAARFMEVMTVLRGELLNGEASLDRPIGTVRVGATTPHSALDMLARAKEKEFLLVTPGDRDDMILTALVTSLAGKKQGFRLTGLVLTCDIMPSDSILQLIRRTDIPVLAVREDSFQAASKIKSIVVKISPRDKEKARQLIELVTEHVDLDRLLEKL